MVLLLFFFLIKIILVLQTGKYR